MFTASVPQRATSRRPFVSPPAHQAGPYRPSVAPPAAHGTDRDRAPSVAPSTFDGPRPFAQSTELTVKASSQLPRELQQVLQTADFQREAWSGHIDLTTGFGFVLSPTACFVWNASLNSSASTTCYIFPIPHVDTRGLSPVASLVPNGTRQEPGLILGSAVGEVRFWDNIGMGLSGGENYTTTALPILEDEIVSSLYRCDDLVYLVSTTFGRLFRLTVSTSEGKPQLVASIFTISQNTFSRLLFGNQYIPTGREGTTTIAFGDGNIRQAQGKDVWVVNQQNLQRWRIFMDSGEQRVVEINIQELLKAYNYGDVNKAAFIEGYSAFDPSSDTEILDIAVIPDGHLILLVSFSNVHDASTSTAKPSRSYVLARLSPTPSADGLFIERVDLVPYGKEPDTRPATSPRLALLDNGSAAFIHFGDAATVVSLAQGATFREALTLKSNWDKLLGFGSSSHGGASSEVLVTAASSGILNFSINLDSIKEFHAETPTKQLKATLEQAVFLGSLKENPFVFTLPSHLDGSLDDAARSLSKEILRSQSPHLRPVIDQAAQLAGRQQNLRSLITFINENGAAGQLSLSGRKALSSDAEKILAISSLWYNYNQTPQKFSFLPQVAENHLRNIGEWNPNEDVIRVFCRTQVDALDKLLIEMYQMVRATKARSLSQKNRYADLLSSINRAMLLTYDAVICHRRDTVAVYGLVQPDNCHIPSWTSDPSQLEIAQELFKATARLLTERITDIGAAGHQKNPAAVAELTELRHQLKDLAYVLFYLFKERVDYLKAAAREDGNDRELKTLEEQFAALRPEVIRPLVQRDWSNEAFALAEKYRDFRLLTELSTDPAIGSDAKIQQYIQQYGDEFAFKLYEWYGEAGQLRKLFTQDEQHNAAVSRFLKVNANPRVSWLHSLRINEFEEASEALLDEAAGEQALQAKLSMLSIGKLCVLATAVPGKQAEKDDEVRYYDDQLDVVSVQERLLEKFREVLSQHHSGQAQTSEAELITTIYTEDVSDRPAFRAHFKRLAKKLFQGKTLDSEELIDLLTLKRNDERTFNGFTEALEVYGRVQDITGDRLDTALKTIWRRALIQTDWAALRSMPNLTDDLLVESLRNTALYILIEQAEEMGIMRDDMWLSPNQAMGVPSLAELSARFPQLSNQQVEDMLDDYTEENALLGQYLGEPAVVEEFYAEAMKLVGQEEDETDQ